MMDDSMPYSNIWKLNKTKCVCVGGGGEGGGGVMQPLLFGDRRYMHYFHRYLFKSK